MTPYYRHFGLERDPFLDTADPHFYRTTPALARARDRLVGGVLESRGLQIIVGEPGTGKTSLMAQTERELLGRDDVRLGKILDPSFATETEFLLGVARSFGLALPPRSPAALKNALKNYLYDAAVLDGLTIVLLVDEAQNASDDIFEVLRLLLNYDVPQRKLLNIVLFGQTELRPRVELRRNLADRVDEWYELGPLDDNEARALIAYRISRAGGTRDATSLFDDDVMDAITGAAAGTPRRLLTLAHATLREAAAYGRPRATRADAEAAARMRGLNVPAPPPPARAAASPASEAAAEPAGAPAQPARRWWWPWLAAFRLR
ncbi:MAG TPA: AAA family ATPase [Candidatus Elarobacter sp.]|jgi:general secretion pathway protein A|nr:AAA family ATPase [Candidatus Elarobacter sp.]